MFSPLHTLPTTPLDAPVMRAGVESKSGLDWCCGQSRRGASNLQAKRGVRLYHRGGLSERACVFVLVAKRGGLPFLVFDI